MATPTAPTYTNGTVNTSAMAEYFIRRYNLVGRDAEYTKNRPTLKMLPRDTDALKRGDMFYETLKIGQGFAGSPDWVLGNRYHAPSTKVRWAVDYPFPEYARIPFDTLALKRNNLGTLLDIKGSEVEDVKEGMLNNLEFKLWKDGKGNRGQIASVSGTTTMVVTLVATSDTDPVFNIEYGMHIRGDTAADGSGTAKDNIYKVTDLNPLENKFTCVLVSDASEALAADDYIFVVGAENAYMPGIPTFIPSSAPSDTLYGVARTGNPALSGWRFPFKASISETIQRAFSKMGKYVNREAGKFVVVLSTTDWLLLSMERESRVIPDPSAHQKWGLEGLTVRTSFGPITCIAIPQVTDGRGYIIDWSSWKLYTLGNLPHVVDEDGNTFVRGGIAAADGYANGDLIAMQMRMWTTLLCLKPMSNATFPTTA